MQQNEHESTEMSSALHTEPVLDVARRRRLLLAGLKGGALMASVIASESVRASAFMVPTAVITTNYKTTDNTLCSVSGAQSGVASRAARDFPTCSGYAPSHFVNSSSNPPVLQYLPTAFASNGATAAAVAAAPFNFFFDSSTNMDAVLAVLQAGNLDPNALWLAAYFSALLAVEGKVNFPFGTQQLNDAFADPVAAPKYLAFFKQYLHQL